MNYSKATLIIFVLLTFCISSSAIATNESPITFSFESITSANLTLPYRKAVIAPNENTNAVLVIYLHGGTSKGNNNTAQLEEPGIDSISNYLSAKQIHAVFLVPQCPIDKSWGATMNGILYSLISTYTKSDSINTERIYIFGGSMGGTGTWSMVSAYPNLFAAAMPVAGDPSRCSANNVAQTPIFTVMGTSDNIMSIDNVTTFTNALTTAGGTYMFEIETGWSHATTCIQSYTTRRLDWVFSQTRNVSGIQAAKVASPYIIGKKFYSINGQQLSQPPTGRAYITQERLSNGEMHSKVTINNRND